MAAFKMENSIGKKTWAFTYTVYVDGKAKRRRKEGFKTKKEAEESERILIEKQRRFGSASIDKKSDQSKMLSYEKLYEHFKETKMSEIEESSWASKEEKIANHVTPYFKNFDMWYISADDIRKWHKWLDQKTGKKTGQKLSLTFKNDIHAIVVQMLNHAISYFNLERNVASIVGGFRAKVEDRTRNEKKFYTISEFAQYSKELNKEPLMWIVYFNLLFFTGIRRAESKGLKWIDVNLNSQTIHIQRNVVKNRN